MPEASSSQDFLVLQALGHVWQLRDKTEGHGSSSQGVRKCHRYDAEGQDLPSLHPAGVAAR